MEGDRVVLTLHSAMALEYARKVGLDARLETLMLDVFRLRVQAVLCCQEDVDEQHKRLEALEAKAREAVREQAEQAAKETRSKPKREAEGRIMGAAIGAAQTTPVGELAEDSGRVTVRGEVIAADCRELSGGKMRLLTFSLTDYTSTIGCKALLFYSRRRQGGEESHAPTAEEIARVEAIAKAVRPGCWLTVRGDCQYDKFAREVVVRVSDIEAAQAPVREDRAGAQARGAAPAHADEQHGRRKLRDRAHCAGRGLGASGRGGDGSRRAAGVPRGVCGRKKARH